MDDEDLSSKYPDLAYDRCPLRLSIAAAGAPYRRNYLYRFSAGGDQHDAASRRLAGTLAGDETLSIHWKDLLQPLSMAGAIFSSPER